MEMVPLGTAVALVIALAMAALETRRTPDWQVSLWRYFEASEMAFADVDAVWVAEARSAGAFPAQALVAVPADWTWQSVERIPPPVQARCVRVQWRGASKAAAQLPDARLVLGYHDDGLHHAGWVVHHFRADVSEGERREWFAAMGCTGWKQVAMGRRMWGS